MTKTILHSFLRHGVNIILVNVREGNFGTSAHGSVYVRGSRCGRKAASKVKGTYSASQSVRDQWRQWRPTAAAGG